MASLLPQCGEGGKVNSHKLCRQQAIHSPSSYTWGAGGPLAAVLGYQQPLRWPKEVRFSIQAHACRDETGGNQKQGLFSGSTFPVLFEALVLPTLYQAKAFLFHSGLLSKGLISSNIFIISPVLETVLYV